MDNSEYFYGNYAVKSISNEKGTTVYSYSVIGTVGTVVATRPAGTRRYTVDLQNSLLLSATDELGGTTSYTYGANLLPSKIAYPEGNYVEYAYDGRGNVILTTSHPKPASPLAAIAMSASYPDACINPITCNLPTSTTDALGHVTDYTYDPVHGGVLTRTSPAPTAGAPRPQTRYSYVQLDSTGVPSASGVFVLARVSACATQSSCTGTADETVTTYGYGRNLLPVSVTTAAGDGSVSATQALSYDKIGNVVSIDGPLPGSSDTTYFQYDNARRVIATISPDPDGGGPLKQRVERVAYNAYDQRSKTELGTTDGPSAAQVAAAAVLQSDQTVYDAYGRALSRSVAAAGTTYALSQYSYNSAGRLECSAQRMNPAAYSALPASACDLTAPLIFGDDRISKTSYDAVGHVLKRQRGVENGVAVADDVTLTYTANGKVATATDAKGNVTSYAYDGFDRLWRTCFQVASSAVCAGSPSDYEQLTYDAAGNITARRLRDGQSLFYAYDALGRRIHDDNPSTTVAEVDVDYSYDNLGRLRRAIDGNGWFSAFEYDALGRTTRQYSNVSSNRLQYDLAGRLIQQTWADNFYVTYDHLLTGETSAVHENGAAVLASFGYDDLGRRTSLTRGNGTVTAYSYDGASQLTGLTQDLAGTSQDLTRTFSYNPAGQIIKRTSSNALYDFNGYFATNRPYAANGLNQYTASGSVTPTYDARGNLTSAGSPTYAYNSRNQLYTIGSGTLFYRNPMGTLSQILSGGGGSALDYVGSQLVTETDAEGQIARRYVYGPGTDEPILWYEGNGTADRRYLHADERGSIIAVTNTSGVATAINSYDEFGIPGAGNVGRFQYTGQKWIPELGLYDFKARMYSPTFGRFLQTDPIGYRDGLNWYDYVGADPVNRADPLGLDGEGYTGPDIIVTGIRPNYVTSGYEFPNAPAQDASDREHNLSQGKGHDYRTTNKVCARALSTAEQRDLLSRFGVPNIEAGDVSRNGEQVVTNASGIPGGIVVSTFSKDGLSVQNVTTPVHVFVGVIDRNIGTLLTGTYINTHGYGNAGGSYLGEFRDKENLANGPGLFNALDTKAAAYAAAHYKGC